MISILAICPNPKDATSFYRGMGPLGRLKKARRDISITIAERVDWSILSMVDVVFLQRPFSPDHLRIARLTYDTPTKLWLDFDDDLFSVPTDNPTFRIYSDPKNQNALAQTIALADAVSVSTGDLARKYSKLNSNTVVVPNALDAHSLWYRDVKKEDQTDLIFWRGSNTHFRDLACYTEQIIEVAKLRPTWKWHFQGVDPWWITERLPEQFCTVGDALPMHDMFNVIAEIKPKVMIVPLADHTFNHSKSNIAWIEGSLGGAVAVAPDWEEWRKPGVITYKTPQDFQAQLLAATDSEFDHYAAGVQSWEYIQRELTLEKVNEKRSALLNHLLETPKRRMPWQERR